MIIHYLKLFGSGGRVFSRLWD